jgi:hypothetical protein
LEKEGKEREEKGGERRGRKLGRKEGMYLRLSNQFHVSHTQAFSDGRFSPDTLNKKFLKPSSVHIFSLSTNEMEELEQRRWS